MARFNRAAAVLLFADEPGSLLAAFGSRADIRLMVYAGKEVGSGATPNLRKPPKTIRGPLIEQIDTAVRAVLDELAQGLTLASSGFKTRHKYPERVVKEAIVNAVIHRDYRLNRDIVIRIFDDRIAVENEVSEKTNLYSSYVAAKARARYRAPSRRPTSNARAPRPATRWWRRTCANFRYRRTSTTVRACA
ncbi:MAG: hypothetical protein Q8M01_11865 [Rubrivivax sp.]|nr:hypothetical protein [Rubrivivax sp.]